MYNNVKKKTANLSGTNKSLRELLEEQVRLSHEKELRATPMPTIGAEPDYSDMSLHEEMEARKQRLRDEKLRDEKLALQRKDEAESLKNRQKETFWGENVADLTATAAQAGSYGFSDEINGLIGGTGEALAYPFLKGKDGYNRDSLTDAFQNGYRDYRDYTRERLNNTQERIPAAATAASAAGSFIAPSKILPLKNEPMFSRNLLSNAQKYAISRGVAGGIGESEGTDINDYVNNITRNVGSNLVGTNVGNRFLGRSDIYKPQRSVIENASGKLFGKIYNYFSEDGDNDK